MKRNGFSCPPHWQQVVTWIVFAVNNIFFYIFTRIILLNDDSFILIIVFSCLSLFVFIIGIISTVIDPSDRLLRQEIDKRKQAEKENKKYVLEISKKFDFCVICCSNINSNSKHCKECNRCVDNFDHHCNWLNNCVGDINYRVFFTLLIVVLVDLIYNIGVYIYGIVIFIQRTTEQDAIITERCENIGIDPLACPILSGIIAFVDFIISFNIVYLISVHSWLRCKGMTTYEYIVKYLLKEEDKDKSKSDVSENMMFKMSNSVPIKKGRNKIMPEDLMERISKIGDTAAAARVQNRSDKIIIDEKDYNDKIFKPIVDDIYFEKKLQSSNTKQLEMDIMPNVVNVLHNSHSNLSHKRAGTFEKV
jgi:hypothetical protein